MSYYDLNERAVLAMKLRLQNKLNAVIDAVNANTAADPNRPQYMIDYPQQVLDAPPLLSQLISFPVVAIADGPMTATDDLGWTFTGNYEMAVCAYIADADPEALAWKLRRYAQAIVTTAIVGRNVDEGTYLGAWGLIVKKIVPGRRVTRTDPNSGTTSIVQYVCIIVELKDEQNAP